ncbi:MAG: hypothetical protein ABT01_00115 [Clostridium sp. SCN 57-10]|nr:MAG: hypothetical protein ABT01_00115 [Clostridium sp. SCN 57-10]
MVIYTAKLNLKKVLAAAIAVILVVVLLILLIPNRDVYRADDAFGTEPTSAAGSKLRTNAERVDFIRTLGYTVKEEPLEEREVLIPREWNETYAKYNELQKTCGFDLTDYKGKRVTMCTFAVVQDGSEDELRCELLLYKNRLVGGSVYTVAVDGFMRGLTAAAD